MIHGERVRLRRVERGDLDRFVGWLNDPQVRSGISLFLPMGMDEEEIWYQSTLERDGRERPLSVDVLEGEEWVHVGSCGFFDFNDRARSAELGIMIGDSSRWGQGIGRDALSTLINHGFDTLNLNRIFLRVFEDNERAIQLYRRLGFVEEGRLREGAYHDGRYWDTILMGLLRREWEAGPSEGA